MMHKSWHRFFIGLTAYIASTPALAGPPFEADDPVPTDVDHWEIYAFAAGTGQSRFDDVTSGLDLNYGAISGLQLTATVPIDFARADDGWVRGVGDIEIGAKYRVVDTGERGFQIAIFPRVFLPTSSLASASGKARVLLPVWAQQDIGDWSVFGGGGYFINPGKGNRNNFRTAIAVTKSVRAGLMVGAEASWEGADTHGGSSTNSIGLGSTIHLLGPASLLLSGGPTFSGSNTGFQAYSALGFAF